MDTRRRPQGAPSNAIPICRTAYARSGLVGNPSDVFAGKDRVIAVYGGVVAMDEAGISVVPVRVARLTRPGR